MSKHKVLTYKEPRLEAVADLEAFRPLRDYVVIRPWDTARFWAETFFDEPRQWSVQLVAEVSPSEEWWRGEVVQAGPGAQDDDGDFVPVEVKPGDEVVYERFASVTRRVALRAAGQIEEFVVLPIRFVLAVIE